MRYLPGTEADRRAMLAAIGVDSIEALYKDVPEVARRAGPIEGLPMHQGELAVERALVAMARKNLDGGSAKGFFVGAGSYRHHVPASVDQLIQRGEFLTAYTPYQPEVSQGTLQVLFEFQTMVAALTGMEVANASMYDGATAATEAVLMAKRLTRRSKAVLAGGLHPHYADAIRTYARFNAIEIDAATLQPAGAPDLTALAAQVDDRTACVVVQTPDLFGRLLDITDLAARCHEQGALLVAVFTEAVSLGAVTPPGAMGADIVVGEGQSIGVPMGFGGPHVGLFATRSKFVRQMPGRLCGQAVDEDGRRGFVLTLAAREQHIRRDKATSNICTNSGLCALAFTIHLSLLGEDGLKQLAAVNHARACTAADRLAKVPGVQVLNDTFFNEFTLKLPKPAAPIVDALAADGILAGVPLARLLPGQPELADLLLVAATEINTRDEIETLATALEGALS
ncbi:aminomethyl-transferring glycine dehydrogenase subunit GcvPA [Marinivivus vitaminiproducens]|uniref:aminomethyl-transferring glycine dehydrogenase subunit GcvPA n=1 Tax=Marinivivus vitaminiproducens TaxID=3035935 RepID=UPI0027A79B0E|nr:aminomethyl-transferring glycine dehydrogenase subunit GcvPA [Geminicoccaceae bacterium SCSIO 64248]